MKLNLTFKPKHWKKLKIWNLFPRGNNIWTIDQQTKKAKYQQIFQLFRHFPPIGIFHLVCSTRIQECTFNRENIILRKYQIFEFLLNLIFQKDGSNLGFNLKISKWKFFKKLNQLRETKWSAKSWVKSNRNSFDQILFFC